MAPELLDCVEVEPEGSVEGSCLWLHGLGDSGHGFEPVVHELGLLERGIRFVLPHAPVRPVTVNGGMEMRAWYDIRELDLRQREDEESLRASQAAVEALIVRETERGVPRDRICLAGFSQGGAIALQTALRASEPLAAVLALSTYLPLKDCLEAEATRESLQTPIFQAHGSMDPVIPLVAATQSRDRLLAHGYQIEWHEYPMPHAVHPQEIADIAAFLGTIYAGE